MVCHADPNAGHNDGIFGSVGNGASDSGTGPAGVCGTADAVDTITVTSGQSISLSCNAAHPGQGTYVSGWSLPATKTGTLDTATP